MSSEQPFFWPKPEGGKYPWVGLMLAYVGWERTWKIVPEKYSRLSILDEVDPNLKVILR